MQEAARSSHIGKSAPRALLASAAEEKTLSRDELVTTLFTFVFGGHETTTCLLSSGMKHLLLQRESWEALIKDPSLIPQAVEELLRFDTASPTWRRTAMEDVEVGGVAIPRGSIVLVSLGSANHDEAYFNDPGRLDIRRENAGANVSFSRGPHDCIGAPLARLEAQITLEVLTKRIPGMRLVKDQAFAYNKNVVNRALKQLLVEWDTP